MAHKRTKVFNVGRAKRKGLKLPFHVGLTAGKGHGTWGHSTSAPRRGKTKRR